ncbi:MAG: hypothetical protein ACD_79C00783G0002 [uncultured bacterium]|nr:MAG: hypothetical protein ACD_79C00783G0002 [uncultured bacterium]
MGKQAPPKAEKDRSERWLLTYADLITLLLIFFIIMYVFSVEDKSKFKKMADSLYVTFKGGGFMVIGEGQGPSLIPGLSNFGAKRLAYNSQTEADKTDTLKKQIDQIVTKEKLGGSISVLKESKGIVIRVLDNVLFNTGTLELTDKSIKILREIGEILSLYQDRNVRVEGHTDNVSISNPKFSSNWELSALRAVTVVKVFIDLCKLEPAMFSAVGNGQYRPIADNDTLRGRKTNRRVEIIISNEPR